MSGSPRSASFDPMMAWSVWLEYVNAALSSASRFPRTFEQPIQPGWTIAGTVINETNSGDPAMEHAIVGKQSYGRQIGRMADALAVLIEEAKPTVRRNDAITAFTEMKDKIDKIKRETEDARFKKVLADLEALQKNDNETFQKRIRQIASLGKAGNANASDA